LIFYSAYNRKENLRYLVDTYPITLAVIMPST